jgi:predicted ATP-dependent protease
MKESAMAALSYVRAHARDLGVDDDYFQKNDIHIHVPAGAIPKDGPSAGVTMATAICSLVTGTPISSEVAMTGEVTLTGQVLPIGGLKEKTLAAQRAGIHTVILPTRNQVDLEDVPENLRADMTFVPVDRVEQVWETAMGLTIDGRRAGREIAEAHELLEEAQELLGKARKQAADKAAAQAAPSATKDGGTAKGRAKRSAAKPAPGKPVARVKPKSVPARQKGQAKKTTAARGRSGRKK